MSDKQESLISIVLPVYNGERFLADSIESVMNQTYKNWELIIVNDCSCDNTLNIADSYAQKDKRIRVISNIENLKLPISLNVGFKNAKGKYYTWTSDDNIYRDNAIEIMVNYLEKNPSVDMVSCKYDIVEEDKTFAFEFFNGRTREVTDLIMENNIGACFMYTSEIAHKTGEYRDDMFCAEDYDYWCRIALLGNISYLDDNLYLYRKNTKSLSATRQSTVIKRAEEIRLKYGIHILQKYGMPQEDIVKKLTESYLERNNYKWIMQSVKIDFFKTIKFCLYGFIKNSIQKYRRSCLLFNEELRFLFYLQKYKNKRIAFWGASIYLENLIKKYHIK